MDDLPLAQETDDIVHIRAVGEAQDVIVSRARLLFCCYCTRTTGIRTIENTKLLFSCFSMRLLNRDNILEIPMDFDWKHFCFLVTFSDEDLVNEHIHMGF